MSMVGGWGGGRTLEVLVDDARRRMLKKTKFGFLSIDPRLVPRFEFDALDVRVNEGLELVDVLPY